MVLCMYRIMAIINTAQCTLSEPLNVIVRKRRSKGFSLLEKDYASYINLIKRSNEYKYPY